MVNAPPAPLTPHRLMGPLTRPSVYVIMVITHLVRVASYVHLDSGVQEVIVQSAPLTPQPPLVLLIARVIAITMPWGLTSASPALLTQHHLLVHYH